MPKARRTKAEKQEKTAALPYHKPFTFDTKCMDCGKPCEICFKRCDPCQEIVDAEEKKKNVRAHS